jgi:hypothetical protein
VPNVRQPGGPGDTSLLHMHVQYTAHWHGVPCRVLYLSIWQLSLRRVHMHVRLNVPDQTYAGVRGRQLNINLVFPNLDS